MARADQARLLALWDLADTTWPHGVPVAAGPAGPMADAPSAGAEYRRWRAAALVSFGVIVVLLAGLLSMLPAGSG